MFLLFGFPISPRRLPTIRLTKVYELVVRVVGLVVLADQKREHRGEEHENQRLHDPDQQLHKVERDGNQPRQRRKDGSHRLENVLAGKGVTKEPEAQ